MSGSKFQSWIKKLILQFTHLYTLMQEHTDSGVPSIFCKSNRNTDKVLMKQVCLKIPNNSAVIIFTVIKREPLLTWYHEYEGCKQDIFIFGNLLPCSEYEKVEKSHIEVCAHWTLLDEEFRSSMFNINWLITLIVYFCLENFVFSLMWIL